MKNEEFGMLDMQKALSSYVKREESVLHRKSKAYAGRIIKMVRHLSRDRSLRSLHDQVLRSGTSIYSNILESEFAQSPADFANKLSISLKEANETIGWLELLYEDGSIDEKSYDSMRKECEELLALLISSIKTTNINQQLVK